ncbi:MAG: hypothetical protein JO353_02275 [Phycisphaerae bacterium]|nr:hypothetical protein [Phycisphaerae bacterium]
MLDIHQGQCGLCSHFGEDHQKQQELTRLYKTHIASETLVEDCSHPKHATLHLKVTAISGCDGFEPVRAN